MADIHVLVGTTTTLEVTFYADGVPADDGTPTIGITKADGSVLVNPGTATSSGGTGIRRYQLAAQTNPASLTATWTGSTQVMTTHVEIVGALLFTIAAVRAVKVAGALPFNATDYPNTLIADRRTQVTDDFEARTGYSFIPRFARETFDGDGQSSLILSRYLCQRLLSITVDGAAQTTSDYVLADTGLLQRKTGGTFPATAPQNVVVEYVYGWARPPAEISAAGLARTAGLLQPSQFSGAVTVTTPDGASYQYSQAGQSYADGGRRYYGIPDIDAVLSDPAYNARGAGVFA